jgi:hypothetical protein
MNLKEIKDAARQAFRDQQQQDTEGGVPDAVSYCAGFLAGARHVEQVIDRADLIQTNREDVLPAAQEAAHYTWLDGRVQFLEDRNLTLRSKVECLNQVNDGLHLLLKEAEAKHGRAELVDELTSILDLKKETIVEMQNAYETLDAHDEMLIATVKKMNLENEKLINALQFYAEYQNDNPDNEYNNELARQVLKEIGEE